MRVYRDSHARHQAPRHETTVASYDLAVLKRNFQFIRDDEADLERGETDWEVRMSVRYYRKLFREYALADLSRYKEGKVGLRWRTEMEVVAGKGQFVCGNKRCDERHALHSYELLFAYMEHGDQKRCLVTVRACEACARKLFYRKLKDAEKERKRTHRSVDDGRDRKKQKRSRSSDSGEKTHEKRQRETPMTATTECHDSASIHAQCAAINATETRGLHQTIREEEGDHIADDKATKELATLLL